MKASWKKNVVFVMFATLILVVGDMVFSFFSDSYQLQPKMKNIIAALVTFFLISLLKHKKSKVFVLMFISVLMFIEMAHLSYYGTMFEPLEAWLFFIESQEVINVVLPNFKLFLPAVMISLSVFVLFFWLVKVTDVSSRKHVAAGVLLFVVYMFPPIASSIHGSKFWKGATMDTFTFNASYRSLADFLARVLPEKIYAKESVLTKNIIPVMKGNQKPAKHIVLIIGESLNLENMQLFGYQRETTPYLSSLKQKNNFYYKKAVSCGVFTSTSLSFLLNATCHERSYDELVLRQKCVFDLAKAQGYQTAFISGQTFSQQKTIVNFICPTAIDVRYNKPEDVQNVYDQDFLQVLDTLDWSKPQFIVLQMRGSHAPYDTYPKSFTKFDSKSQERQQQVRDKYDNTVAYSDKFFKKAFEKISSLTQDPIHILFTSDHGEQLGQAHRYGHGFISKHVVTVPVFYYQIHPKHFVQSPFSQGNYISHIEVIAKALGLMGYVYYPKYSNNKLFTMGPDMEGDAGYAFFDVPTGKVIIYP